MHSATNQVLLGTIKIRNTQRNKRSTSLRIKAMAAEVCRAPSSTCISPLAGFVYIVDYTRKMGCAAIKSMGHADLMTVVADVILHTVVVFFYDARSHRKNDGFTTENANAPFVVVSISRRCHSSGGHHVERAFL